MTDVLVTCINKTLATIRITELPILEDRGTGGRKTGKPWKWTRAQVIESIDAGTNTFFTSVKGKRADIEVIREKGKDPYVRTRADGVLNDNLLELVEYVDKTAA